MALLAAALGELADAGALDGHHGHPVDAGEGGASLLHLHLLTLQFSQARYEAPNALAAVDETW